MDGGGGGGGGGGGTKPRTLPITPPGYNKVTRGCTLSPTDERDIRVKSYFFKANIPLAVDTSHWNIGFVKIMLIYETF